MASSSSSCDCCGRYLVWAPTGRPRRFCGSTCRSRAWRDRVRRELPALDGPAVVGQVAIDD